MCGDIDIVVIIQKKFSPIDISPWGNILDIDLSFAL